MTARKIGRVATGSPQPPPGGGLLLMVTSPSARLRAWPSGSTSPAAASQARRPAVRCRTCALRRLRPEFGDMPKRIQQSLILNFEFAVPARNRSGPQLRPAKTRGDPYFASARAVASQAASRSIILNFAFRPCKGRAGRSLGAAEARSSLASLAYSAGCAPNWRICPSAFSSP